MRFVALVPLLALSCTYPFPVGSAEPPPPDPLDERGQLGRPLDVLIVADNSGSMCEEHQRLLRGLFEPDACPIEDLNQIPEQFMYTPLNEQRVEEEVEPFCGLAQVLAAYQVDTRVGFISTDVSDCDNSLQQANRAQFLPFSCTGELQPERGRVPQRGCLQAAPGAERKFVSTRDEDFQAQLEANLALMGTFGSGFERGFDAAQIFLTPGSDRAPGCEGDLESFIREDARLLVVFLSDEDDCSHANTDAFPDENVSITCEDAQQTYAGNSGACYDNRDDLRPVTEFANFLRGTKARPEDVFTMVTAGLIDENGTVREMGCSGSPEGPIEACVGSRGASNIPSACGPDGEIENCCEADAAPRYSAFAEEMGAHTIPICSDSISSALVSVAKEIAQSP